MLIIPLQTKPSPLLKISPDKNNFYLNSNFNFIPVLVEPNPVWNHVTNYLQKGAFVPVRHLLVLQISPDVIPVKSNALVDVPGFEQILLVPLIRDTVEIVDYILTEHGW